MKAPGRSWKNNLFYRLTIKEAEAFHAAAPFQHFKDLIAFDLSQPADPEIDADDRRGDRNDGGNNDSQYGKKLCLC